MMSTKIYMSSRYYYNKKYPTNHPANQQFAVLHSMVDGAVLGTFMSESMNVYQSQMPFKVISSYRVTCSPWTLSGLVTSRLWQRSFSNGSNYAISFRLRKWDMQTDTYEELGSAKASAAATTTGAYFTPSFTPPDTEFNYNQILVVELGVVPFTGDTILDGNIFFTKLFGPNSTTEDVYVEIPQDIVKHGIRTHVCG